MNPRLVHQPPSWVRSDAVFFVTVCAQRRSQNTFCNPIIGKTVFDSIQRRNEHHEWFCSLALLMPDHIHLLLSVDDDAPLTKAIRNWKSWLAKEDQICWQENFFDHRLRGEESSRAKAEYILNNPVRAGLVSSPQDWPYVWIPSG